mmetsp:Transcript_91790/g.296996  ORF Transcript_91790/g.296996 Transcript_91790/m.296996 type:complete len:97 (-) Transcript_91790:93-383(-)
MGLSSNSPSDLMNLPLHFLKGHAAAQRDLTGLPVQNSHSDGTAAEQFKTLDDGLAITTAPLKSAFRTSKAAPSGLESGATETPLCNGQSNTRRKFS